MTEMFIPERGDIVLTKINSSLGNDHTLSCPVIVLSPYPFNDKAQLALVARIAPILKGHGFEVELEGMKTNGAVLCQQIKTIDYQSYGIDFIEKAPETIVKEVLARVKTFVS